MQRLLWIALGGGLGAVLRWLLAGAVQARAASGFPFGTLVVNVTGCLAIGALAALLEGAGRGREDLRLFVVVGVLGGFTTMSAFAWETLALAQQGQAARALLYALATNALCLLAAFAGLRATAALRGH